MKAVRCARCQRQWRRDPALEVPCPSCGADVGQRCKRPSGHDAWAMHPERDRRALREVDGYEPCPANPEAERPAEQMDLMAEEG